jgi:hypothetical protein
MSYTLQSVSFFGKQFRAIRIPEDLSELLKIGLHLLQLLAISHNYNTFNIRKRNGKSRFIEDPEPHLKQVQKHLNHYLQSVYYFQKPLAAYGFQIYDKESKRPSKYYQQCPKTQT